METNDRIRLNKALLRIFKRADALADSPEFLGAFKAATHDAKLQEMAIKEPRQYLESKGVKVPGGLAVTFLRKPVPLKPTPDYEFFTIRLFRCRTYWLKKLEGPGYEKVEVCFGFQIDPHPVPGGPIAWS